MPNGRNDHQFILPMQPSRLERVEANLNNVIDIVLGLHALCMVKGLFTHEELDRMVKLVAEVRPKLGKEFTVEDGIKAIVAAFHIEGQP